MYHLSRHELGTTIAHLPLHDIRFVVDPFRLYSRHLATSHVNMGASMRTAMINFSSMTQVLTSAAVAIRYVLAGRTSSNPQLIAN